MTETLKVLTIFGTRPDAIKLFPLVHALNADPRFISRICVSGQHREMLDQVLHTAQIVPDHDLRLMQPHQTLDSLTTSLLTGIGEVLDVERPDWVIVQGDTATAMAGALAAYFRKIRVAHVEAGLRSGNIYHPWPEEVNRKVVTGIAALHFAPTHAAAAALARENVDASTIHVTGNTVIDALHWVVTKVHSEPRLASGLTEIEHRFAGKRIVVTTTHRRESFGEGMARIARAVRQIAGREDVAVIFPVHLNPNVREIMGEHLGGLDNVALIGPLDYPHFARLLDISTLILTDSGGVQEEAAAMGKPVLVMRETTERFEGVEAGTAKLVGTDANVIVSEVFHLLDNRDAYDRMAQAHNTFGDGRATGRIMEALAQTAK